MNYMKTIKNYFMKFWPFKSFEQMVEEEKERINKLSPNKQHEQLLIEKVITLLKTKPENFSAKWSGSDILDHSVKYIGSRVLISERGAIFSPISPVQTGSSPSCISGWPRIRCCPCCPRI